MPNTCPACGGSRRVQRQIRRPWWQVVLMRPSVAEDLCGRCGGIGVVRGTPEEEGAFEERRRRHLQEKQRETTAEARSVAPAQPVRRPVASALTTCVITCQIPADILNRVPPGQTRAVLAKCAAFAGNPVVNQYDIDSGHRNIMCVESPPSVVYQFTVHAPQGVVVSEAMRGSWRELMDDIRRAGIQALMNA